MAAIECPLADRHRYRGTLAVLFGALPVALPATALAGPPDTAIVVRNEDFLTMIDHADPVVKIVMVILLIASVVTWAILIGKAVELRRSRSLLSRDNGTLRAAEDLKQAEGVTYWATGEMVRTASVELLRGGPSPSPRRLEGIEERVATQLPVIESYAIHRSLRGTNILASIGATAPFVGLTGTVWGIMNSFLGIAQSHSTSLSVVAPGIAEALFATAMGLAAAIPAVLIYNFLSRTIAGYRRALGEASALTLCVLSRETEQRCAAIEAGRGSAQLSDPRNGPWPEPGTVHAKVSAMRIEVSGGS